jgi:hypothetical protein
LLAITVSQRVTSFSIPALYKNFLVCLRHLFENAKTFRSTQYFSYAGGLIEETETLTQQNNIYSRPSFSEFTVQ